MSDADVPAEALAIIEVVAGAIRDELGEEVDAYPGPPGARGGPTRSTAPSAPSSGRSSAPSTLGHRGHARARLPGPASRSPSGAWRPRAGTTARSRLLLDEEPGSPDDWLVVPDPVLAGADRAPARRPTTRTPPDPARGHLPPLPDHHHHRPGGSHDARRAPARSYVRAASPASTSSPSSTRTPSAEIAGLCRQEGWSLATWDVDRGLRPGRPAADAAAAVAGGRPAGRDPVARTPWPRPTARRCWCSANFHRFLDSAEVVQALDTADRTPASRPAPSSSSSPRSCRSPSSWRSSSSWSSTTCPAATSSRRSPARSPPSRASCPRATAWTPCSTRRPGLTRRGRERLQPLAGPPRPARPRRPLGAEDAGAEEVGPADACTGAARRSPTWAAWRPSRRSAPAPCGPGGRADVRARGVLLLGAARLGQERRSPRRWATRRAGRRWSSTSAP